MHSFVSKFPSFWGLFCLPSLNCCCWQRKKNFLHFVIFDAPDLWTLFRNRRHCARLSYVPRSQISKIFKSRLKISRTSLNSSCRIYRTQIVTLEIPSIVHIFCLYSWLLTYC
uniref:(northern house mosquito) hypothetical protein n=1 Tax=Culex pipiens TaxID=7175 RepID=A0A8D8F8Y5_CULPI